MIKHSNEKRLREERLPLAYSSKECQLTAEVWHQESGLVAGTRSFNRKHNIRERKKGRGGKREREIERGKVQL